MDGNEHAKNKKHKEEQPEPIESTLWNVRCRTPDSLEGGSENDGYDSSRTATLNGQSNDNRSNSGDSSQERKIRSGSIAERDDGNIPKSSREGPGRSGLETAVDDSNTSKPTNGESQTTPNDNNIHGSENSNSHPSNGGNEDDSTRQEDLQTPVNVEITPDVSQVDLTKVTTE